MAHLVNHKLRTILPLIFFTFVICNYNCSAIAGEGGNQTEIKCDIHKTSCTKTLPDCTVTLDINPKPVKAMTDLTFAVTISGEKSQSAPYIDLGMPGMKMGPNQVKLESVGNHAYAGKGIIVRCPSGRRTWKAAVTVPDVGIAEFIFDVIY